MTLRNFLLIDSALCDVAGVALLVTGETLAGVIVLVLGALAFVAFLAKRREIVQPTG